MPNDAELRRTGMSFTRAFTATAMCSPSRATFLTGKYPSRHGVTLTMTQGDLFPDRANVPDVLRTVARLAVSGEVPRSRLANRFVKRDAAARPQERQRARAERPAPTTLASLLRERGYHVAFKGKWHLSKPVGDDGWSSADSERIERDYGFAEWEPPDAGGDAKAATFGGGNAGTTHEGWDEDYTRQMERWLGPRRPARAVLPGRSRWSIPHDVLGYPSSFVQGGLLGGRLPRARRPAAGHGRRGPARQADGALADEARADRLHRRARRPGGPAELRGLLRLPAQGGGREDRASAGRARRSRRPGVAALAHGDRPDLRPR